MDIPQFRLNFPEFTDVAKYPDSQIAFWAAVAEKQVNLCAWGQDMYSTGVNLYVAHEIALAAQSASIAAFGGNPGIQSASGPISSKTVGNATYAFDTVSAAEKDAGWWNLTTYGKQFIRLARMFGAGAIQL